MEYSLAAELLGSKSTSSTGTRDQRGLTALLQYLLLGCASVKPGIGPLWISDRSHASFSWQIANVSVCALLDRRSVVESSEVQALSRFVELGKRAAASDVFPKSFLPIRIDHG
jgi:hypothetical protein